MIILGVILAIAGFLLGVGLVLDLGIVLIVIGVILLILGSTGHAVRGRKHYW
jgi:hypothetical protein